MTLNKTLLAVPLLFVATAAEASSHQDAPLITFDDPANTTDVYAFISERSGTQYLTAALAVYPFEEPGIGPNKHNFDDDVLYEIHVSLGDDLAAGKATISYQFSFKTRFKNKATILQSYLGVINDIDDANQNLTQTYEVRQIDRRRRRKRTRLLGHGVVPPNNQGIATPFYNMGNDGERRARDGVASAADLDRYTQQASFDIRQGHRVFAGQRDDGFYADIQAIFDLLQLRPAGGPVSFDSQGGFNVHTIVIDIPLHKLGGPMQVAGVFATTSRRRSTFLLPFGNLLFGQWVQVARQGNPLFCEGLVALTDKDIYSRTAPSVDQARFARFAREPELAALINAILFGGSQVALETGRTDLEAIFIPDLIKVDLSTGPARLAGSGPDDPKNPDDPGFSRLSIFGGDTLVSRVQSGFGNGVVPGGWPNGRRFGDDVVDIAVSAILSDLRDPANPVIQVADGIDNVSANDIGYNKVFPYAATPLNGRNH